METPADAGNFLDLFQRHKMTQSLTTKNTNIKAYYCIVFYGM